MKKLIILLLIIAGLMIVRDSYSQFNNKYSLSRSITTDVSGLDKTTIIDTIPITNTSYFSIEDINVTEVFTSTIDTTFNNPGVFSICVSDTLSTVVKTGRTLNDTDQQNRFNFHISTFNSGVSNFGINKSYVKLPDKHLILRFTFRPGSPLTNTNLTISYNISGTYQ